MQYTLLGCPKIDDICHFIVKCDLRFSQWWSHVVRLISTNIFEEPTAPTLG